MGQKYVQTNSEGFIKNVDFITPVVDVLMIERGLVSNHRIYALFSTHYLCTLFAIALRVYNAVFQCHCLFLFILCLGAAFIKICA